MLRPNYFFLLFLLCFNRWPPNASCNGNGEGQGSLTCCSPWGRKESDTTRCLNNNKMEIYSVVVSEQTLNPRNLDWNPGSDMNELSDLGRVP